MKTFLINIFIVIAVTIELSTVAYANCTKDVGNIYIYGFVTDNKNNGLANVTVVITDQENKLFSLRTSSQGWFETPSPLDNYHCNRELRITAIKSYYELTSTTQTVDDIGIFHTIKMAPVSDSYNTPDYSTSTSDVLYGHIFDDQSHSPIRGAVITVYDKDDIPFGSAVTRESGNFSLYYPNKPEYADRIFDYTVNHNLHDSRQNTATLENSTDRLKVGLKQDTDRFSFGLATHIQITDDDADLESGGAIAVNLTTHFDKIVVTDSYLGFILGNARYKSGLIGIDISAGVIPYLEDKSGDNTIDVIKVYGIGLAFAIQGFPLPLRTGITYSNTDKTAFYLGINIPLFYF